MLKREREYTNRSSGEGEREREKQNPAEQGAQCKALWGHDLSQRQMIDQLSHPGAPQSLFLVYHHLLLKFSPLVSWFTFHAILHAQKTFLNLNRTVCIIPLPPLPNQICSYLLWDHKTILFTHSNDHIFTQSCEDMGNIIKYRIKDLWIVWVISYQAFMFLSTEGKTILCKTRF